MWGITNIILILVLLVETVLLLMAIWHICRSRAKLPSELIIILFLFCSDLGWPIAQLVYMSAEHHKLVGLLCTLFANMCVNISVTISALIAASHDIMHRTPILLFRGCAVA
jgi:hypothetical protein